MASTEHKTLWEALLAFKAEAPPLPKDKVNPHFKSRYTALDTIAERIDPLLTKHGLVWVALPGHQDGHPTLDYQLAHALTGEVLKGTMLLLLDKENSQGLGSALTYCRRYAKTAVLDLVADEDDDGNGASRRSQNGGERAQPPRQAPQTTAQPAQPSERAASGPQKGAINARMAAGSVKEDDAKAILQWAAGTAVVDRVSKAAASKLIDRLGQDGSGAQEILDEISTEAERGDERARTIVSRYFEVTPHA